MFSPEKNVKEPLNRSVVESDASHFTLREPIIGTVGGREWISEKQLERTDVHDDTLGRFDLPH